MISWRKFAVLAAIHVGAYVCASGQADAQSVEEFYRGKTVTLLITSSAGGEYDVRGRLMSRHIGRFIPGQPTIVPRNMPGGGGITATNWMFNAAPKDGTVLMIAVQTMPTRQAIGNDAMQFDVRKLSWIGNTSDSQNVVTVWTDAGVKTVEDARRKELVIAATGFDSGSYYYPAALNMFAGTKFKIVTGYPGGNDMNLAMERGEAGGRGSNSWDAWKATKPDWIVEKKIIILSQVGLKRHPELADVPLMQELATTDEGRDVLRFLSADTAIARPLVATPDMPPERLRALRKAFDDMMRDKDFLAEAEKLKLEMTYMAGEEAQAIAASIIEAPANVRAKAKELMERK